VPTKRRRPRTPSDSLSQRIIGWFVEHPGYHSPSEVSAAFDWLTAELRKEMNIRIAGLWTRGKIMRGGCSGEYCYAIRPPDKFSFKCLSCGATVRPLESEREKGRALCVQCFTICNLDGTPRSRWALRYNEYSGQHEGVEQELDDETSDDFI